jgi:hypothetical protein
MEIVRAVVVTVVVTELVAVTGSVVVTASGFIVVGSTSGSKKNTNPRDICIFRGFLTYLLSDAII